MHTCAHTHQICSQTAKNWQETNENILKKTEQLFFLHDDFSYNYDNKHTKQNKIRAFHKHIFRANIWT